MSIDNNHRAETPESPLSSATPASSSPAGAIPAAMPAADKAETPSLRMPAPGKDGKTARQAPPERASAAGLTRPGPASRLFGWLSALGLPVLMLLTALMTLSQFLVVRPLWFSDEVRHADVYMRLLEGHWLPLNLNGLPYSDKPPLYFWFLQLLDRIPGVDQPLLFFLGTALSAVLFTAVTWLLARATGHDRRVSFAAGLVALGCLFVAGTAHYPRMDLLFAATMTLSLLCLYRGWIKKSAPIWLTLGFVLAAVATLIKGPLGLAFPLLSSLLFLFWRGTPGRLNGRDGLLGFALMLVILLTWLGALFIQGESEYLREIFSRQIVGRMVNAWHHAVPWWYYLAALPLVWLPWTFVILFIDWWKAARQLPEAWKNRREDGGRGWLWLTVIGGMALLSVLSDKTVIHLLPLLPALAVLTARAVLRLSPLRSRCFFASLGLFFGLTGLVFVAVQFSVYWLPLMSEAWITKLPALAQAYLDNTTGLALMGAVFLLLSVVLLFLTRRTLPDGSLLLTSLGIVLLMQPYSLVVAPSLQTMLSPRDQAEAMSEYVRQGYAPAAYRVYPGVYAYYVAETLAAATPGQTRPSVTVPDLNDSAALEAFLADHPRAVVAMSEKDWIRWEDKPSDMFEAQRQWMVNQPYVLAVRDAADETPPSEKENTPLSGGEAAPGESALTPAPEQNPAVAHEEDDQNAADGTADAPELSSPSAGTPSSEAEEVAPEAQAPPAATGEELPQRDLSAAERNAPSPPDTPDAAGAANAANMADPGMEDLEDLEDSFSPHTPPAPAAPLTTGSGEAVNL